MDCFLMIHDASNIYLFYFILFYGLIYFFFQVKACQEIWDASTFVDGIPSKLFWLVHLTQGYLNWTRAGMKLAKCFYGLIIRYI